MEFLIILLFVLLNGFFAMSEIAVVSSRKSRLETMAAEGTRGAEVASEMAENPNRLLSTVQIGITLVGVLAGAYGEAALARGLAGWLREVPTLAPYSRALGTGLVVLGITYVTLVLGELAPKRAALQSPERIAAAIAPTMRFLSSVAAPLVQLLSASTDLVLRLLGRRDADEAPTSEAEIQAQIRRGAEEGVLEPAESHLAENILRLDDQRVSELMTPRSEMACIDVAGLPPRREVERILCDHPYSGVPVVQGGLDNVLGILHLRDWHLQGQHLWERAEDRGSEVPATLSRILHPPLLIFAGKSPMEVLEQFKRCRAHLSLVVDEYGIIQGQVTMEDLLRAMVGYVPELAEAPDPDAVQREDGSWLLDGMLPIERFKALFHRDSLPEEGRGGYHSLGGFVMMHLGRVPRVSEEFQWEDLRFEVVDMDGNRVDKVLVRPV